MKKDTENLRAKLVGDLENGTSQYLNVSKRTEEDYLMLDVERVIFLRL